MKELDSLKNEIKKIRSAGYNLSFVLTDVSGGVVFSENADWKFCSQSTIKAPYVCSLIDARPELFDVEEDNVKEIITVSDNLCYENLRKKYGDKFLEKWCYNSGVDVGSVQAMYPRNITVKEMAWLWTEMYKYISEKAPEKLRNWFYGTKYSAIYEALGEKYLTWTKSGWENGIGDGDTIDAEGTPDPRFTDGDPLNDETATNDTGVVFSEGGTYILVIFTNIPTSPHSLNGLVRAIDDYYQVVKNGL